MQYIQRRKERLKKMIASLDERLDALDKNFLELSARSAASYGFDSGEGSQRTTLLDIQKLHEVIHELEAERDHYENELFNMGVINIQLRRKNPCLMR